MITDIFLRRYPTYLPEVENSFFVQLSNIYDDYDFGIHRNLLDKVSDYPYSTFANEHIRIISQAQKRLSNELGRKNLDNPRYKDEEDTEGGFSDYRIFKNYIFDESVKVLEKISFFELLFRDTEAHLLNEINFIEAHIPEYEALSAETEQRIKGTVLNFYNLGSEKLKKSHSSNIKKKTSSRKHSIRNQWQTKTPQARTVLS